jgi:hypothetical protein
MMEFRKEFGRGEPNAGVVHGLNPCTQDPPQPPYCGLGGVYAIIGATWHHGGPTTMTPSGAYDNRDLAKSNN